jgi:hypothetical protein
VIKRRNFSFMINPATIAGGVAVGVAAERTNKFVEEVLSDQNELHPSHKELLKQVADNTRLTAEALNTNLTSNLNLSMQIFPYPRFYQLPNNNRKHVSIFFPSGASGTLGSFSQTTASGSFYFGIPGVGIHVKTINAGWCQIDLPPHTEISTADGNTYSVVVSFRDDPIGTAL